MFEYSRLSYALYNNKIFVSLFNFPPINLLLGSENLLSTVNQFQTNPYDGLRMMMSLPKRKIYCD